MEDSSGLIEAIAYGGVLCCCCTIFLALIGGAVYFVMQSQKKSTPSSAAMSAPSTPSISSAPSSPFGSPSASSVVSPFSTPSAPNVPSGPPPGDARATLDGLNAPDKPYVLEAGSAFKYMVRWPSADTLGLSPAYQLEINLDDANRTARFVEMEAPLGGTPGAASAEAAKNDVRAALTAIGWRVQ